MYDLINNFITYNVYAIIFIIFLITTYLLRTEVGKLVDRFLAIKNLKTTLFVILILMIFLVSNTFYDFISIDANLVAPYMIALSALMASVVAAINIINNNIKNTIDKSEKAIALIHTGIAKINFFTEKSTLLKLILMGESRIQYDLLTEYEIMLRDILNYLNREDLCRYISDINAEIFYQAHNSLIIFLPVLKKLIHDIGKDSEKCYGEKIKVYTNIEFYEKFIENLDKLIVALQDIKTAETKQHQKLYDEQQRR